MKRSYIAGLGATIAFMAASQFIGPMPVIANSLNAASAIAQNVKPKAKVELRLTADKQVHLKDQQGKQKISWQSLQGTVVVQPGDVIRYTVTGANNSSDASANHLVVTQPIPKQTVYVLNSVAPIKDAATVTYSIDNGKTFVEKPTIKVKLANGKVENRPAPAEFYTHIRWKFNKSIAPKTTIATAYQVKVR